MPTVWGTKDGPCTLRLYSKYAEAIEDLHQGDRLRIKVEKDRNGKFNSLYHVMLDRLARAINRGPATTSIDELKKWVKIRKGWYDVVPLPQATLDGQTHAIDYHSTSFASMGEEDFERFTRDTCELILAELAPWVGSAPEWEEVQKIIGQIRKDAA